jgi:hypothetical protein
LKFQFSKGACIYHFATEVSQEEIYEYLKSLVDEEVSFVLTEFTDKMSLHMKKNVLNHLLDLTTNEGSDITLSHNDPPIEFDNYNEDEDENLASLLELITNMRKPSLDSILEKIKDKGISSLTEYEKDLLKEYSNN